MRLCGSGLKGGFKRNGIEGRNGKGRISMTESRVNPIAGRSVRFGNEGGAGTIRLNEPGPGGGSPPEGEGRRIDNIRVIDDWVYFDLNGWQTPGLPVEKLLRNAPERLFRWQ